MGCTSSNCKPSSKSSTAGDIVSRTPRTNLLTKNFVTENVNKDIRHYYNIDNTVVLGTGMAGKVQICEHKVTGIEYALKVLRKDRIKPDKLLQLKEEIKILMEVASHPNIIQLHETFETESDYYLILELCRGGELLERLEKQVDSRYNEPVAAKYVHMILNSIKYLHTHGIVHRDLKLQNFLFVDESLDSELKLIDFGLSQHYDSSTCFSNAVGTPHYIAPEALSRKGNEKVDIWSIGVITYMLLSGTPPFSGPDDKSTLQTILAGQWTFQEESFNVISEQAKDFIRLCLIRNPSARPSAAALSEHIWLKEQGRDLTQSPISLDIVARLTQFDKRSRIAKLCMEVVAHTLHPDQIKDLRKEFVKCDTSQSGEITIGDLRKVLNQHGSFNEKDLNHLFADLDTKHSGTLSYHDFLAATVSRKSVTEGNMKIAFEKMAKHAEYIYREDIINLLGTDVSEDEMKNVLSDLNEEKIDFAKFKNIMSAPESPMITSPYKKHSGKFFFSSKGESKPSTSSLFSTPTTPRIQSTYRINNTTSSQSTLAASKTHIDDKGAVMLMTQKLDSEVDSINLSISKELNDATRESGLDEETITNLNNTEKSAGTAPRPEAKMHVSKLQLKHPSLVIDTTSTNSIMLSFDSQQ